MIVLAVAAGVFGSLIGSFLNVVVHRVPAGLSVVSPPSACPQCRTRIRPYDNLPVISWLALRGRCRDCGAAISVRYPLVELGTALFFVLVVVWFGPALLIASSATAAIGAALQLIAFLYLAAVSVALTLIDLETRRLPNAVVLPSYPVGLALLGGAGLLTGDFASLASAGLGLLALSVPYFLLAFFYPKGMGFGDVKLAGVLGLYLGWVGWDALLVGAFAAFLLGGLFAIVLVMAQGAGRKTAVPFGPWMLLGAWIGIAAGPQIAAAYLGLFGIV